MSRLRRSWRRPRAGPRRSGDPVPYRGLAVFGSRTGRSAGKRPRPRCWTGCRGCWRAWACWWCWCGSVRGNRRCCGRGCCRGSERMGWRPRRERRGRPWVGFTPTRAPLDELALRVAPLAGADAAAVRRAVAHPGGFALTARQAVLARPLAPAVVPTAPWPSVTSRRRRRSTGRPPAATSSRSCSPSAQMRSGRSSPPCTCGPHRPARTGSDPSGTGAGDARRF